MEPLLERLRWGALVNIYANSPHAVHRWIAWQQALYDARHPAGPRLLHDDIG